MHFYASTRQRAYFLETRPYAAPRASLPHEGNFRPTAWWDWSDNINFDYRQPGLRQSWTEAMHKIAHG